MGDVLPLLAKATLECGGVAPPREAVFIFINIGVAIKLHLKAWQMFGGEAAMGVVSRWTYPSTLRGKFTDKECMSMHSLRLI